MQCDNSIHCSLSKQTCSWLPKVALALSQFGFHYFVKLRVLFSLRTPSSNSTSFFSSSWNFICHRAVAPVLSSKTFLLQNYFALSLLIRQDGMFPWKFAWQPSLFTIQPPEPWALSVKYLFLIMFYFLFPHCNVNSTKAILYILSLPSLHTRCKLMLELNK